MKSLGLKLKIRINFKFLVLVFTFFSSFLLSASAGNFSFAAFGDSQGRYEVYKLILNKITADPAIAFGIHCGDLTGYGTKKQYLEYDAFLKRYPGFRIYHAQGNHDAVKDGWRRFEKYIGPPYYSFNYQNVHFVILCNAFKESFSKEQLAWLEEDLLKNKKPIKVVAFHKPIFDPSGFYSDHVMDSKIFADRLKKIFERYHVNFVISGHIHGYAMSEKNGVNYIVTAGAGAPLYLPAEIGGFFNYVRFDVVEEKITSQVVRVFE